MRGAWGKPYGTVARVNIGQILLSVRTRDAHRATAIEALRRSMYKFPGRQKIIVSKNWGFTPLRREEYVKLKQEGRVLIDGAYVQFLRNKGNIEHNMKRFPGAYEGASEVAAEAWVSRYGTRARGKEFAERNELQSARSLANMQASVIEGS